MIPVARTRLTPGQKQDLRSKMLAIVQQRPGIPLDRLCVATGVKLVYSGKTPQIPCYPKKLIAALEAEGLVYSEIHRFAGVGDRPKIYPVGYQSKQPPLFKPDFSNEVTVSHVPLSQIQQAIEAPALNPVTPKPMNQMPPTTPDLPIVRSGPTEAERRSKIAAKVSAAQTEKKQLRQAIEDLEERNRELRSQLSQVSAPATIVVETLPLAWLEQEKAYWRSRENELLQEISEREQDLKAIRKNVKSCDRLLALHEAAEQPETKEAIGSVGGGV